MKTTVRRIKHFDLEKRIREGGADAVLAVANQGVAKAKLLSPVDTGRLRQSITAEKKSKTQAIYGSNVEYAMYVEFGTKRAAAQPFLRTSADWLRQYGSKIFAKVMGGTIRHG